MAKGLHAQHRRVRVLFLFLKRERVLNNLLGWIGVERERRG